jgi:hypothetical protein
MKKRSRRHVTLQSLLLTAVVLGASISRLEGG